MSSRAARSSLTPSEIASEMALIHIEVYELDRAIGLAPRDQKKDLERRRTNKLRRVHKLADLKRETENMLERVTLCGQ